METAWVMINISSGDTRYVDELMKFDIVRILAKRLDHPDERVCDQAGWALGNIAGDSVERRDIVTAAGVLEKLCEILLAEKFGVAFVRTAMWTLSNWCAGNRRRR